MRFAHRPARKWQGIASFSRTALAFRPNVTYVVDTAYAGVLAGCLSRRLTGADGSPIPGTPYTSC